jgi:hypothetical protein
MTDRKRRLRYYPCALELVQNSLVTPEKLLNPNGNGNFVYRFFGRDKSSNKFVVQIYEDKRTGSKYLISVFPEK